MKYVKGMYEKVWGDSTLYAGMLIAVGDHGQFYHLYRCLGEDGRIWRNPEAAQNQVDYPNSSSRDMMMGMLLGASSVMLYSIVTYLRENDGLLCPTATDNRNKIGVLGWANLGVAASSWPMRLIWYYLLYPFLGLISFISALTVYKGFQLNLIFCELMFYEKHGVAKWWLPKVRWVLREVRTCSDLVFKYVDRQWDELISEVPHMWNRHRAALNNTQGGLASWPSSHHDSWFFSREMPSEIYCYWVQKAAEHAQKQMRSTKP